MPSTRISAQGVALMLTSKGPSVSAACLGTIGGELVPTHALAMLSPGDRFEIAAADDLRFILLAANPINEPIVQYGPFVMTTREEIEQAFVDYRDGSLVRTRAAWVSD